MTTTTTLHPVQAKILSILLFSEGSRFSALSDGTLTNDHFTFHIKRLQETGLVEKDHHVQYRLTRTGKEFANRLNPHKKQFTRQAKSGVNIVVANQLEAEPRYLMQQRMKQPYFGFYGFITDKIRWGETVLDAAERELLRETGLTADLRVASVEHRLDYLESGELQEDKFFYVVSATNPQGRLRQPPSGGENTWLTERAIVGLPKKFAEIIQTIEMTRLEEFTFTELRSQYSPNDY